MADLLIVTQAGDDFTFDVDPAKLQDIRTKMRWGGNLEFQEDDGTYIIPYHSIDHIILEKERNETVASTATSRSDAPRD